MVARSVRQGGKKSRGEPILKRVLSLPFPYCSSHEHCPVIMNPNVIKWHWGFDDPAKATGTEEEIMTQFRNVRDAIKSRIETFVQ